MSVIARSLRRGNPVHISAQNPGLPRFARNDKAETYAVGEKEESPEEIKEEMEQFELLKERMTRTS